MAQGNYPTANTPQSRIGSANSSKKNYQPNARMRQIEERLVALEKRIRSIEDKILRVQRVTKDRKGQLQILVKK